MDNKEYLSVDKVLVEHTTAIKELEKRMNDSESSNKLLEYQYKTIIENLQELKNELKELKSEPKKRWDLIIGAILSSIATYIVATMLK